MRYPSRLMPILLVAAFATGAALAPVTASAESVPEPAPPAPPTVPATPRLAPEHHAAAAADYQRYCALCHGDDRQGHVNDHAPSLRSRSLLESSQPYVLREAIAYGRPGTPMAPYLDEVGGPMTYAQIERLNRWLVTVAAVEPVAMKHGAPGGDAENGAAVYVANCASCHGVDGEGGTGTALANAAMLALSPDGFLRHAIVHGRQDTPMPAFADTLGDAQIDDVVAFLRSRGSDWSRPQPLAAPPAIDSLVINPGAPAPDFQLSNDLHVSAAQLSRELAAGKSMILLDTRVPSVWRLGHIAGAAPLPYYSGDDVLAKLPRDGTWIVAYCECPRAAAESVVRRLRAEGFLNTAVLYEGIQGWVALGYPTVAGIATAPVVHGDHSH